MSLLPDHMSKKVVITGQDIARQNAKIDALAVQLCPATKLLARGIAVTNQPAEGYLRQARISH